jgi:putative aldouronate transport system permease protein
MEGVLKLKKLKINPALRRKDLGRRIKKYGALYGFIAPALIWFALFCYVPMFLGILLAFKEYTIFDKFSGPFANPFYLYIKIFFTLPELPNMIKNTFIIALIRLFLFPAPIILALMLNEVKNPAFKKVVQTITYMPFFISWLIVTTMLEQLLSPYGAGGPLYIILQALGNKDTITFYMIDKPYFYPLVIFTYLWKTTGWNSIIYLAALSNINKELADAAKIDGVDRFQMIWHIYLPTIKPIIGLLFIQSLGSMLSAGFEQIYFLQSEANIVYSDVLDVFVVVNGLEKGNYTIAAIAGLFQGLIGLLFIYIGNTVLRKTSEISLW